MELRWHFAISTIVTAVAVLAVGVIGIRSNPRSRLNRLWALYNLSIAVWAIGQTVQVLFPDSRWTPLCVAVEFAAGVFWIPTLMLHLSTAVCDRPRPRVLWFSYIFSLVCTLTVPTRLIVGKLQQSPPLRGYATPGPMHPAFLAIWIALVLYALGMVVRATAIETHPANRRRLGWFALFAAVGFAGGLSNYLPVYGVVLWPYTPYGTYTIPIYVLLATYAIIRCEFLELERVIRRGVIYSLLIAWITALYLVSVVIVERWFQGFFGYRSLVGSAIVAFLVAVFFNPIRELIQAFVDRALLQATPTELADQRERLLAEVRTTEQMKAVSALAAGLAHEIKNPLATIKTFTEHLDEHLDDLTFRIKFKRIVGGEIDRINLIAQRMLDFARPTAPNLAPLDVSALLDQTLEFLSSEIAQRHAQVTRSYGSDTVLLGDAKQLRQVFLNLLLNSLQAVNGNAHLAVRVEQQDHLIRIEFEDNGGGIAPKDLARVFEPFYTTKATGTGLGLAVVQSIVKEHGGRITIRSAFGKGTTVAIDLPAPSGPPSQSPS